MADVETIAFPGGPEAFEAADAVIADHIVRRHAELARSILVGLSGAQGSGKTTTSARLRTRLEGLGLRALILSLDDFYLTRAERAALASSVHPLLTTRGVPGTHDVAMLSDTVRQLSAASADDVTVTPAFDKAQDDRAAPADWPCYEGRPDVMVLEGWCVGAAAQDATDLAKPINALEADEDPDGVWRGWVNDQLAGPYAGLFAALDYSVALVPPNFDCVQGWRTQQEAALRLKTPGGARIMSETELARFIAHYERITCALIANPTADLAIWQDADRRPVQALLIRR